MRPRMNDEERQLWVLNDESLYRWWQSTGKGLRAFVTANREQLDAVLQERIKEMADDT